MRVIINADDLGCSVACNDVIFDLMDRGRITSATIMANCAASSDALTRAVRFRHCSFGVHLNATAFQPLRSDPALAPLMDGNGQFSRKRLPARLNPTTRRALLAEFCAQVDRILEAGITISHLDSHHHVHNLPAMFPVLKAVQRRYNIRKVRITQNLYAPGHRIGIRRYLQKTAYNWALRNFYRTTTTDGFTDLRTFCKLLKAQPLSLQTVELMVHPGPAAYEQETALLASAWSDELRCPVQKISYHQL